MACDHHNTITTQDGTRICRHCFASVSPGFRVPNSFATAPATTLDVTGISIGLGVGGSLILALVALGITGAAGAFVLAGRLLARTAGF